MTVYLQIAAAFLGGVLNALLTCEALYEKQKWWKIAVPGLTAIGLFGLAAHRAGLLSL